MAFRGRSRGRGDMRPTVGRGGIGFGAIRLRDEGLRITVPNFSSPPEAGAGPPPRAGVEPGPHKATKPTAAVPGFKSNAFKPIGPVGGRDQSPVMSVPPQPQAQAVVKRPVQERLGPQHPLSSAQPQHDRSDPYEPISPDHESPRGMFEPAGPDESIRITVGNEKFRSRESSHDRRDGSSADRDSLNKRDSHGSKTSRSRDSREDGKDPRDSRNRDRDRGYTDTRDRDRDRDKGRDRDRDRDRDRGRDSDRRDRRRDSPSRSSGSARDERSRGRHSREASADRSSRSSRQGSTSRSLDVLPDDRQKDDSQDLYDDLPAPESLPYPMPQSDPFRGTFPSSRPNWEHASDGERRRGMDEEEEEMQLRDSVRRERLLREEILKESREKQSLAQFSFKRDAPKDSPVDPYGEPRAPRKDEMSGYTYSGDSQHMHTLPGLGDDSLQGRLPSPPPPKTSSSSQMLPGMALSQNLDIDDEDEFLYGDMDEQEKKKEDPREVQPKAQSPVRSRQQEWPPSKEAPQREHSASYSEFPRERRPRVEEKKHPSLSQDELLKLQLVGREEQVMSIFQHDDALRERLRSVFTGDTREDVLRQKRIELVELLAAVSSRRDDILQQRPMGSSDAMAQGDPYRGTMQSVAEPRAPQHQGMPASSVRQQEPDKPNTDTDPMIRSILKSIGFNFELSKLMQEKAEKERERLVKKPDPLGTYGIKQPASSFLQGGLSTVDMASVFDSSATSQSTDVTPATTTAASQKKSSILSGGLSYAERARRYKEEQMKAYAAGKASPPPMDEWSTDKPKESSPEPYQPSSPGNHYQQDVPYAGYTPAGAGYEYGYYDEYGQHAAAAVRSSNLTVIQPEGADSSPEPAVQPQPEVQRDQQMNWQTSSTHQSWPPQYPDQSAYQSQTSWPAPQLHVPVPSYPPPPVSSQATYTVPGTFQYQPEHPPPEASTAWHSEARVSPQTTTTLISRGDDSYPRQSRDEPKESRKVKVSAIPKSSKTSSEKTSNRTVLPPRHELRRGSPPRHDFDRHERRPEQRGPSPRQDLGLHRRVSSPGMDRSPSPSQDYRRAPSPPEERRRAPSPRQKRERELPPRSEKKEYIRGQPSRQKRERELSPRSEKKEYDRELSPRQKRERLPSPGQGRARPFSPPRQEKSREMSPPPRQKHVVDEKQKLMESIKKASEQFPREMPWGRRDKLTREMEERHKRLRALSRELERLRQQQNELLRKKKRQKDGHKDPLILENTKLQDEIAKQITTLRKAAEDNAVLLEEARQAEMRRVQAEVIERKQKLEEMEKDTRTPGEKLEQEKAARLKAANILKGFGETGNLKQEPEEEKTVADKKKTASVEEVFERPDRMLKLEKKPAAVETEKKTITVEKTSKEIKTVVVEKKEAKKAAKKPEKKHYEYFDPGNYWCGLCNCTSGNLHEMLEHLHTNQHATNMDPYDRPWLPDSLKNPVAKLPKPHMMVGPLTGVEFLMPTQAFYCSLCKVFAGDKACGEEHLKTHSHNQKYQVYLNDNPYYEKKRNLDKAAGITLKQRDGPREKRKAEESEPLDSKRVRSDEKPSKHRRGPVLKGGVEGTGSTRRSRSRSRGSRSRSRSPRYRRSGHRSRRSRSRSWSSSRRSRSTTRSRSRSRSSSRRRSRSPSYRRRRRSRSRSPKHRSPRYKRSRSPRHSSRKSRSRSPDRSHSASKGKASDTRVESPTKGKKEAEPESTKDQSKSSGSKDDDKKRFSIKLAGKNAVTHTNILRSKRRESKPLVMPPKQPAFLLRKKMASKDSKDKDTKETADEAPAPLGQFLSITDSKAQGKSLPVIKEPVFKASAIADAFKGKGEDVIQKEIENAVKPVQVTSASKEVSAAPVQSQVEPETVAPVDPVCTKLAESAQEMKLLGIELPSDPMTPTPPPLASLAQWRPKGSKVETPSVPLDIPLPDPTPAPAALPTVQKPSPAQVFGPSLPPTMEKIASAQPAQTVAKPTAEVPVTKPAAEVTEVTVTKPAADVKVTKPAAEVTVTKPAAEVTVTKPAAEVAVTKPAAEVTVTKPAAEVTVTKPAAEVTVTKPAAEVTVTKPAAEVTVTKPAAEVTVTKPAAEVTVTKPAAEVTVTKPGVEVTVTKPAAEVTVTKPAAEVTVTKPAEATEVPVTKPAAEVTIIKPAAEVTVTKPAAEVTVTKPGVEVAVTKPAAEVTVTKPSAEVTIAKPAEATEVTVAKPAEAREVTVTKPSAEVTVTKPAEATEVTVTKPAEATAVTLTKPAEVTDTKPTKATEVTDTKPAEEQKPGMVQDSSERSCEVKKIPEQNGRKAEESMELTTAQSDKTEESMEQSTGSKTEESMEQSTGSKTEESMEQSTGSKTEESTEQTTGSKTEESMEQSTGSKTEESMEQSTGSKTEESMEQSTGNKTEESMEQSTGSKTAQSDTTEEPIKPESVAVGPNSGRMEDPMEQTVDTEETGNGDKAMEKSVEESKEATTVPASESKGVHVFPSSEENMMTALMEPLDDSVVSELMQSLGDPDMGDIPNMMEPTVTDLLAGIEGQPQQEDFCSEAVLEIAKLAHSVSEEPAGDSATAETATDSATAETATESVTATDSVTTETATDSVTTETAAISVTAETASDSVTAETAADSVTTATVTDEIAADEAADMDDNFPGDDSISGSNEDSISQGSGSPVKQNPTRRRGGRRKRGGGRKR